jgi:hypothetical protein
VKKWHNFFARTNDGRLEGNVGSLNHGHRYSALCQARNNIGGAQAPHPVGHDCVNCVSPNNSSLAA